MKAQQLRTVIVSNPDLVVLHEALTKLRNGQGLTAVESGVVDEDPIANVELLLPVPQVLFDGTNYTQVLYVSMG